MRDDYEPVDASRARRMRQALRQRLPRGSRADRYLTKMLERVTRQSRET